MYDTRGAKYVATRGSGTRYVAVRNDAGYYQPRQTRYVAVRNVEVESVAPRYVAIRNKYPIHRIDDTRYAEVRSGYRNGNGVVRYINVEDEPRVVAVRRVQPVRYVAVPQTRYV